MADVDISILKRLAEEAQVLGFYEPLCARRISLIKKIYEEQLSETNILCFKCKIRYGVDCPGRKEDEPTLCKQCLLETIARLRKQQADYLRDIRKNKLS